MYAVQAWSPWTREDIDTLENVQRRALKMTTGLKGQTCEQRLLEVNLTSLEDRRLRGDLKPTWKILHGYDKVMEQTWFTRAVDATARTTRLSSCAYNLTVKRFNSNLRKNSCALRVIKPWNS